MKNNPNPVLVEKYRGNTLESFHRGAVCLIDHNENILYSAGNPYQIIFPRSSLKFSQQLSLIDSGAADKAGLTEEEIAITCGSHNGEEAHCRTVRSLLGKAGATENDLLCGPQLPALKADKKKLFKEGKSPVPIQNNCSGKHAGFILLAQYMNAGITDYIDPEHPVQQQVKKTVSEIHNYDCDKMDTALDGCSAPIFSMPLFNLAAGLKNMMFPESKVTHYATSCRKIIDIISRNPYMIAGSKRYCTDLMNAGKKNELIAKTGADGIFVLGFRKQKWTCAIKIDDGTMGPQYAVAQEIVRKSGILDENACNSLEHYRKTNVKNRAGNFTGITTVNEAIFEKLQF